MMTINESINRLCEIVDQMSNGYILNLANGGTGDLDYELDMEAIQNVARVCKNRGDELQAAVADLKLYGGCQVCKFGEVRPVHVCADCDGNEWKWRGICPENSKEE